jgi:two-component system phosphate regulon response regulator PhoB
LLKTVLLIEDDDACREELAVLLERGGHRVVATANGLEALTWLHGEPVRPDIILLDWMMPVMDGLSFLGQQASDPQYAPVPVVVVSAVTRRAHIPSLCVAAVVEKPVNPRHLLALVDHLTSDQRDGARHLIGV